ncbi:MAG: hypothetical protein UU76_C0022G0004 [Parcubacteria group bacterium GW2011_GWC1_41_7]|nr:MAG: hypothetical protein UU76_C0022G0004 [Parcubacteria group bacterium GW2011_GWC1_41_7]
MVSMTTLMAGCGSAAEPRVGSGDGDNPPPPADTTISGTEQDMATRVKEAYTKIDALVKQEDPSKSYRMEIPVGSGRDETKDTLRFTCVRGGAASYRHLRVVRESNGDTANLVWGWEGLAPSLILADDQGNTITRNGNPIEVGFSDVSRAEKHTGNRAASDWIAIGVKVAALAFAVWLGASITKLAISAVAFVAFNAFVLALLVAAAGVLAPVVNWIKAHISLDDVQSFFQQVVDEVVQLFRDVAAFLSNATRYTGQLA